MLQRAASNAYSWWWASHIRTKQSKWLDTDLEEMEDRVKSMLKIIEGDGDSFAKKAEIYFKKRPELVHFVEETYKAYRALAERYDHISGELHKANHTIATAFPDQVQFDMQDEEDDNLPKAITSIDSSKLHKPPANIPKNTSSAHKIKETQATLKKARIGRVISHDSKEKAQEEIDRLQKGILVLQTEKEFVKSSYESGIARYWEIEKEITEMQDEVFQLQDEFSADVVMEDEEARALMAMTAIKSCEKTLVNLHEQQKRSVEEARMESEKIKLVKEKIEAIKEENGQSEKMETSGEGGGMKSIEAIKEENVRSEKMEASGESGGMKSTDMNIQEISTPTQENLELQSKCDKVEEHIDISSDHSVEELAEKINELVIKVINFEVTASSQTAQIKSLRLETDALHKQLQSFEEERKTLIDNSNIMRDKLLQAEEELHRMHNVDEHVQNEKGVTGTASIEHSHCLSDNSEKMLMLENFNIIGPSEEDATSLKIEPPKYHEEKEKQILATEDRLADHQSQGTQELAFDQKCQKHTDHSEAGSQLENDSIIFQGPNQEVEIKSLQADERIVQDEELGAQLKDDAIILQDAKQEIETKSSQSDDCIHPSKELVRQLQNDSMMVQNLSQEVNTQLPQADDSSCQVKEKGAQLREEEISLDWLQSLADGLEGKEKVLLAEYTSILRNYKDTKKKLLEAEKKNLEYLSERTARIKELESANAMKDEEIQQLRQNLRTVQSNSNVKSDLHHNMHKSRPSFSSFTTGSSNRQTFKISGNPKLEGETKKDALENADSLQTTSALEEKFRRDIDTLLEENLEFWLRFSTSSQHIQKFQLEVEDLQAEMEKPKDSKPEEGSSHSSAHKETSLESTPIEKQLREVKTEIQVWLEQNKLLQGELQSKIAAISSIQEEISGALEASLAAEGAYFTPYQAAKFQGEVLNIQLENKKVDDEMHAGLDLVKGLQAEVEKALSKLHEKFELSGSSSSQNHQFRHTSTKTRVPLRSFLFTTKPKKKQSIFTLPLKHHKDVPHG